MRNKLVQKPLLFITMWMERFLSTLAKVQNTFQHSAYRKKTVKTKAQIEQGNTSFTFDELTYIQTEGDHLADFSSRGPVTSNDDIKPDITAPVLLSFQQYLNILMIHKKVKTMTFPMSVCKEHPWLLHISLALLLLFYKNIQNTPIRCKSISYEHG